MRFSFLDLNKDPVTYTAGPSDFWIQNKGGKKITLMLSSFWDIIARIGGVEEVPEKCGVQIQPSKENQQTIGVRYVVRRFGKEFVGFGSSNEFSTTKIVRTFQDNTGQDKTNVSGSACYALEMAVKRARDNAIANSLSLSHIQEGQDFVESVEFILDPSLRNNIKHNYGNVGSSASKPQFSPPPSTSGASMTPHTPDQEVKPWENPGEQVLPFGENKGQTLQWLLLNKKVGYLRWLAEKADKVDPQLRANAKALLDSNQELNTALGRKPEADTPAPAPAPTPSPTPKPAPAPAPKPPAPPAPALDKKVDAPIPPADASLSKKVTPPGSFKEKVLNAWTERGYDAKTEAKPIIEKKLGKAVKWNDVTEEEAKTLFSQIDTIFPARACEKCKTALIPAEIKYCKRQAEEEKRPVKWLCFNDQDQ